MLRNGILGGAGRHGSVESEGAGSVKSQDTVKGQEEDNTIDNLRTPHVQTTTPKRVRDDRKYMLDKDVEISPHTVMTLGARRDVAPWEIEEIPEHRKELSFLNTQPSVNGAPSPMHPSPAPSSGTSSPFLKEPQYGRNNRPRLPPSAFSNSFYDNQDDLGAMSPGFHPLSNDDYMSEARRPSVASTSTMSSTGSKRSIGAIPSRFHKKLQGFFGEDIETMEERQGSDGSVQTNRAADTQSLKERQTSGPDRAGSVVMERSGSIAGRPSSRASSVAKPREAGPAPSSEVTPWVFQDSDDVPRLPTEPPPSSAAVARHHHHHRLHLPGHRQHRSHDETPHTATDDFSQRPTNAREPTITDIRNATNSVSSAASTLKPAPRSTSPTPSMGSIQSREAASTKSPANTTSTKRSLFARVTGRQKDDKSSKDKSSIDTNTLKSLPNSSGTLNTNTASRQGSVATVTDARSGFKARKPTFVGSFGSVVEQPRSKKEHSRLPFKSSKRGDASAEYARARDPNAIRPLAQKNSSALWHLDTDMGNLEGIVNHQQLRQPSVMMTPPVTKHAEPMEGFPWAQPDGDSANGAVPGGGPSAGAWDAPDSWAVKRQPDQPLDQDEEDQQAATTKKEDTGPMFFMRIFRADSTFAVISAGINTPSAELIQMMAKKTYLQDELDTYQIVMRKRGLSRQLIGSEKPLQIQSELLEMAGYQESDNLADLGREDHSYLCRFTFLPTKMTGYSSLEKDPGFNKMGKFNRIDLQGRNLVTIPITLYQKAAEIVTLDLSQNLSLDVPKDFMQSCVNLREIKYTSNEATRIPSGFAMGGKLTMVDFSNNRLEHVDGSELERYSGLISLKLSNNILTRLPSYFGTYGSLRSLNLASNNLTEFPDFLGELRSLVDLDVSFNAISSLPCVGKLTSLERLFATNNRLSGSFPDNFSNLINLNSLDVRFNTIDNIDVMSQLPKLEHLMVGHNSISAFEGTFARLKLLFLDHNPVTRFGLAAPVPTLSVLNIASAKLAQLPEDLYLKMSGLTKLVLNKNHLVGLSTHIGRLSKLEHLSVAKNLLGSLPAEIGHLQGLRYLDVRENNLNRLPGEIWYARRLETLNVASNVLSDFPKPGTAPKDMPPEALLSPASIASSTPPVTVPTSPESDELGRLEGFQMRRPSHVAGMLPAINGSPSNAAALRKGSIASAYTASRNPSLTARSSQESNLGGPSGRKDSTMSNKLSQTFAQSLRSLVLTDNRLTDDVFDELMYLGELRQLNLSYNELYDMPPRTLKRWPNLTELYLSGNDLTSLPAEDLEDGSALRILHLNGNKFQVLPAEIGKIQKLQTLDVASNFLKYNVTNWPYDWNWNYNPQLRYLNLSGNKRLEIRPNAAAMSRGETKDLTDFSTLINLRVLGLMDVTLTIPSIPDEGADRRVRTAGSIIGTSIPYGMADTLGRSEHLSTLDMVIPTFRGHEDETVFGLFDGQALTSGGSKIARFLHEKFRHTFTDELDKIRGHAVEGPIDALRRTYLALNKELATVATQSLDAREAPNAQVIHRGSISGPELGEDDVVSGAVATVCYLHGTDLYVSNVGDAQALLVSSEGSHRVITRKHDPAETGERARIKQAGGFVSRQGKLNDALEISRAFGYVQYMPVICAAPHVSRISLKETDEMVLLASRELWEYLTPDFAVDIARSERGDLMRAAQKLRDLAIAFGAASKVMVMIIGISDLRKRERARFRTHSMSMGPSGTADDYFTTARRRKGGRDAIGDSKLARLDQEVDAPTGEVSLVFTDIKNSTALWETFPIAMRSAIKMHNEVMRRHLRIIGGYEVKTEGDAFMVAFSTVTSALLWCFTIQNQLLEVQWPQEILNSIHGQEVLDAEANVIFRGLSVRMGIHWGQPVCEPDPITKRMDYFGPMVNRAARISSVADGGQITVSSDFIAEIQRLLETHIESDRAGSTGSEDTMSEDLLSQTIRRELRSLSAQGFEVKDLGLRSLKGLENPEYIYLMYPHSLSSRLIVQAQRAEAPGASMAKEEPAPLHVQQGFTGGRPPTKTADSQLQMDTDTLWSLWAISLRLEMLCSTLEGEDGVPSSLKAPETAILDRMRVRGGELTDRFLFNFVEHQVSRIETCTTTLALRHMMHPFTKENGILATACPMADILSELSKSMALLKDLQRQGQVPSRVEEVE